MMWPLDKGFTAWKVSVFGAFLVRIFPENFSENLRIQSKCWKILTRKIQNTSTSYAAFMAFIDFRKPHNNQIYQDIEISW